MMKGKKKEGKKGDKMKKGEKREKNYQDKI